MKSFTVNKNDADQRLDKFINKTVPLLPKTLMYKYIRIKRIKVNGKRAEISTRLNFGDIVDMYINDEFFGEEKKDALSFCGTKTGRDVDKFAACGIKCTLEDGYPMLDRARITLKLKKLYADDIKKECFIDTESLKHYANGGYHRMYICQVTDCITA